jgi:exopolysaccharide biosynthesis polyprenyl glycosylphosphotransferase
VNRRASITIFVLVEALLLLALLTPMAHMRSFTERLFLESTEHLPEVATDETWYILLRSLLMLLVVMVSFGLRDLYRWNVIVRPRLVVVRLVEAVITALIVLPLIHHALGIVDQSLELNGMLRRLEIHPLLVVACAGVAFLVAYGLRLRFPRWIKGAGLAERVGMVGRGPMIDLCIEEVSRQHDPSIDLIGVVDDSGTAPRGRTILGPASDLDRIVAERGIQRLVIDRGTAVPKDILLRLRMADVHIIDTASFYERLTGRISPESFRDDDLFLATSVSNALYKVASRLLDISVAILGLIAAAPLFLVTAILIKMESPGPVFYSQERVGANGKPFRIYKFRSMRQDAESKSGPVWAQAGDARVTRVGKWLRKLRVDEIPQLWSVIRHDMALVGPRPEREFFIEELQREIPHFGQRHLVKPGVTGWAQINYSYGASVDDAFVKLQFDLYYIKHRSLAIDIAILLRTIKVVVLQKGAV